MAGLGRGGLCDRRVVHDRRRALAAAGTGRMKRTGINFAVEALEPVTLHGPPLLAERDLMSPYVWQESTGRLGIMVRAVPTLQGDRSDTGVIWAGWSDDGCTFEMRSEEHTSEIQSLMRISYAVFC